MFSYNELCCLVDLAWIPFLIFRVLLPQSVVPNSRSDNTTTRRGRGRVFIMYSPFSNIRVGEWRFTVINYGIGHIYGWSIHSFVFSWSLGTWPGGKLAIGRDRVVAWLGDWQPQHPVVSWMIYIALLRAEFFWSSSLYESFLSYIFLGSCEGQYSVFNRTVLVYILIPATSFSLPLMGPEAPSARFRDSDIHTYYCTSCPIFFFMAIRKHYTFT